jgi:protoporphyrinogen oxidase
MTKNIVIIGAGYTGLAAAHDLNKLGYKVEILESSESVGGLAGAFELKPKVWIEKFYHHWFTSDTAIIDLIDELGLSDKLVAKFSSTGLFYVNSVFRLSSPLDLLKFAPLPLIDRIRTGLMALYARKITDWKKLENISAAEWIKNIGGTKGYELIWDPLFRGKFGEEADNVSAVWFWNKLKLRGGSRGKGGAEQLLYYNGGFGALTNEIQQALVKNGVTVKTNLPVLKLNITNNVVDGVTTAQGVTNADAVICTIPVPEYLKLSDKFPDNYRKNLEKIRFLGNICMILRLKRSLSSTYWLNVADPTFPFVGIIEHTNFDDISAYDNEHIVYISKYLPTSDKLFRMTEDEFFKFCVPNIQRIFPEFNEDWVIGYKVWKANYSQPVITKNYSSLIPEHKSPIKNLWVATMAQVYPEDRGTNYAVQHGRKVAQELHNNIS